MGCGLRVAGPLLMVMVYGESATSYLEKLPREALVVVEGLRRFVFRTYGILHTGCEGSGFRGSSIFGRYLEKLLLEALVLEG